MSKIVTKTGDAGETELVGGERVLKSHVCIEACGMVDELNTWIGVVIANLEPDQDQDSLRGELQAFQSILIRSGSTLATEPGSPAVDKSIPITNEDVRFLEERIDRMEEALPPLSGFILPGGHPACAFMDVTRTVCRRAERAVVRLIDPSGNESQYTELQSVLIFLNRLSDYFFILARYCNFQKGIPELITI